MKSTNQEIRSMFFAYESLYSDFMKSLRKKDGLAMKKLRHETYTKHLAGLQSVMIRFYGNSQKDFEPFPPLPKDTK